MNNHKGKFSTIVLATKRTLLRIHADKSLSNLSGIECLVRITFWSLTFQGGKSYSMSYVLILNRKHFPVSFIRRRITFSALSCCKRISFWLLPSEPIIDAIRENHASSEYARITTRENLKNTRYWISDS